MNCEQYRELISARLDGEIENRELAALEAHLKQCETCTAFSRQLDQLHALVVESQPTPMPDEVVETIMAKTYCRPGRWRRLVSGHYRIPRPVAWAVAVALLMLAVDAVRSPNVFDQTGPAEGGPVMTTPAVQRIVLTESDVVRTYTTQTVSEDL